MLGVYPINNVYYKQKNQTKQNDLHKIEDLNCLIFFIAFENNKKNTHRTEK